MPRDCSTWFSKHLRGQPEIHTNNCYNQWNRKRQASFQSTLTSSCSNRRSKITQYQAASEWATANSSGLEPSVAQILRKSASAPLRFSDISVVAGSASFVDSASQSGAPPRASSSSAVEVHWSLSG